MLAIARECNQLDPALGKELDAKAPHLMLKFKESTKKQTLSLSFCFPSGTSSCLSKALMGSLSSQKLRKLTNCLRIKETWRSRAGEASRGLLLSLKWLRLPTAQHHPSHSRTSEPAPRRAPAPPSGCSTDREAAERAGGRTHAWGAP